MKRFLFLYAFALLYIVSNAQSPYYYYKGKKCYLDVSPNKMLVQFAENTDTNSVRGILVKNTPFQVSDIAKTETKDLYIVRFSGTEKANTNAMAREWKNTESVLYAGSVFINKEGKDALALTNQVIVCLKQESDYPILQKSLSSYSISQITQNQYDKQIYLLRLDDVSEKDALQVANELYETGLFEFADPDFFLFMEYSGQVIPNNTYFHDQWGLYNIGQYGGIPGMDIRATYAWGITMGDPSVKIALFDDAVDESHPSLINNLEYGGSFLGGDHGTACAGILVGNGDIMGVAPNCKLLAYFFNPGYASGLISQIEDAVQRGAKVLSMSFQLIIINDTAKLNPIERVFSNAVDSGCVLVAAIGNRNVTEPDYPASSKYVISVGAATPCGKRKSPTSCDTETTWGSNYGNDLDLMAPGVLIATADVRGNDGYNPNDTVHRRAGGTLLSTDYADQDYTVWFARTSAATPFVSGAAALVYSVNSNLTYKQVQEIIKSTCTKLPAYQFTDNPNHPSGSWNFEVGHGLLNAHAAVLKAHFYGRKIGFSTNVNYMYVCRDLGADLQCPSMPDTTKIIWKSSENIAIQRVWNLGKLINFQALAVGMGWVECWAVRYNDTVFIDRKEIEIKPFPVSPRYNNYSSKKNDTISSSTPISGTFTINAGHTVTFQNVDILCAPDTRIVIMPGGKLIINNAALKYSGFCSDSLWQGISVLSSGASQGIVELNNATIQNAVCAVQSGLVTLNGTIYSYDCGTINASNSRFINNKQAVCFSLYLGGNIVSSSNTSFFKNCEFLLDNNLLQTGRAQVEMHHVNGVRFTNCTFADSCTKTPTSNYTTGIFANSSKIAIGERLDNTPYMPKPQNGCSFSGFDKAIYLVGSGGGASKIYAGTFTNNLTGILSEGTQNLTVEKCEFKIPSSYSADNYGIYLKNSSLYNITNNKFEGTDTTSTGIVTQSSGTSNHFIKNNTFKYLCTACRAIGQNADVQQNNNSQGLVYRCNRFNKNNTDISIAAGGRIRYIQSGYYDVHATGNYFDSSTYNIHNEGHNFTYNYLRNNPKHTPRVSSNVSPLPKDGHCCVSYGYSGDYYYTVVCNYTEDNGTVSGCEASYFIAKNEYDVREANYKMNGFEGIFIDWESAVVQSTVSQLQMADGSNFSITINGLEPSNDLEQQIVLFYEISNAKQQMDKICYAALDLLANNEADGFNIEQYRTWIGRFNTVESDYALADSYIQFGDFVNANIILNNMPTKFPELADDYTYQNYWTYFNIAQECSMLSEGDELAIGLIDGLVSLSSYDDFVSVRAYSLGERLFENWTTTYPRTFTVHPSCVCNQDEENPQPQNTPVNENTPPQSEQTPEKPILSIAEKGEIIIKPNPTNYELQITNYELKEGEVIEIYNVVGQKVYQINKSTNQQQITKSTNNQINNITIDVSHLANGIYYLKIGNQVTKFIKE